VAQKKNTAERERERARVCEKRAGGISFGPFSPYVSRRSLITATGSVAKNAGDHHFWGFGFIRIVRSQN
jgi:hypothetical protein